MNMLSTLIKEQIEIQVLATGIYAFYFFRTGSTQAQGLMQKELRALSNSEWCSRGQTPREPHKSYILSHKIRPRSIQFQNCFFKTA